MTAFPSLLHFLRRRSMHSFVNSFGFPLYLVAHVFWIGRQPDTFFQWYHRLLVRNRHEPDARTICIRAGGARNARGGRRDRRTTFSLRMHTHNFLELPIVPSFEKDPDLGLDAGLHNKVSDRRLH